MDLTYVDEKKMKTLEHYSVFLASAMLSLKTLQNMQVTAIEIGILKEDMIERANTIIWDIRRQIKLCQDQLEAVLELIGHDFDANAIIENLKAQEMTKARSMTRKKKVKT